jgi:hypothetical protein
MVHVEFRTDKAARDVHVPKAAGSETQLAAGIFQIVSVKQEDQDNMLVRAQVRTLVFQHDCTQTEGMKLCRREMVSNRHAIENMLLCFLWKQRLDNGIKPVNEMPSSVLLLFGKSVMKACPRGYRCPSLSREWKRFPTSATALCLTATMISRER